VRGQIAGIAIDKIHHRDRASGKMLPLIDVLLAIEIPNVTTQTKGKTNVVFGFAMQRNGRRPESIVRSDATTPSIFSS
jgi:hypothetical protein